MAGAIVSEVRVGKSKGLRRLSSSFTTTAGGAVAAHDLGAAYGRIVAIGYDAGDMDTGADITLSDKASGASILVITNAGTSDLWYRPSAVVRDSAGVAVSAAATAVDINRDIFVFGTLQLTIAAGGASKSGEFYVVVDEG